MSFCSGGNSTVSLEEFLKLMENDTLRDKLHTPGQNGSTWPLHDLAQTDTQIQIEIDVPGMKPNSLQVELVGQILMVRGERPAGKLGKVTEMVAQQRHDGMFLRYIDLECSVDRSSLQCVYKSGVICCTVDKETQRARKGTTMSFGQ
eukprot:TRINITY_DN2385_c0_g1_i1.p1 TRINITY_DN2385_c0_g1~~TRINITY_DN2385_c0_g1_i1.p1  ORF type:complete len:147 (+),score=13.12 TRINITY_DN2385_c0_g1_i1:146-586(+)